MGERWNASSTITTIVQLQVTLPKGVVSVCSPAHRQRQDKLRFCKGVVAALHHSPGRATPIFPYFCPHHIPNFLQPRRQTILCQQTSGSGDSGRHYCPRTFRPPPHPLFADERWPPTEPLSRRRWRRPMPPARCPSASSLSSKPCRRRASSASSARYWPWLSFTTNVCFRRLSSSTMPWGFMDHRLTSADYS
jgi:hypothetical protein